jgi:hypothetical protein
MIEFLRGCWRAIGAIARLAAHDVREIQRAPGYRTTPRHPSPFDPPGPPEHR